MSKRKSVKTVVSSVLVLVLSAAFIPGALAFSENGGTAAVSSCVEGTVPAESTAAFEKTEIVYASLESGGNPQALYVVNQFDVEQAGAIVDYGAYSQVKGLNQELDFTTEGDAVLFEAQPGTVYYQGDADPAQLQLPWKIALSYTLDGESVSADDLAGASGEMGVHVLTTRNEAADPAFFDSYMLQITFTLDGQACRNIVAEGATMANAGQDRTVSFTVLPGQEGSFDLSATVEECSMAGVQIVALPYTSVVDMPDTEGVEGQMSELSSAIAQLAEGTAALSEGIEQLHDGSTELASGAAAFGDGLGQLDGSSSALVEASAQIKEALEAVSAGLSSADFSQLESMEQLPAALYQLADGLDQLAQGAGMVQEGYSTALAALDAAVEGLSANAPSAEELGALKMSVAGTDQEATVDALIAVYAAAQTVKGTYDACEAAFLGADQALSAASQSLVPQAQALRTIADSVANAAADGSLDQLQQLVAGMEQLAGQYGQFHDGLSAYTAGVSTLAGTYGSLQSGVESLASGVGQTAEGAAALNGGVAELDSFTRDLPSMVRERMDDMMADYTFPEFEPVSFASSENERTTSVQFVMSTPAVQAPQPEEEAEAEEPEQTMWDRFVALFR